MGLLDRLFGVNENTTVASMDAYVPQDDRVRVIWNHRNASTEGGQIFADRWYMFDRMYLAAIWYGTVLNNMRINRELQGSLFAAVSEASTYMLNNPDDSILPGGYQLVESTTSPVLDHFRSTLFRSRNGDLVNRDYLPKNIVPWHVALSVFGLIDSVRHHGNASERKQFAYWIQAMNDFYQQYSPDQSGISLTATQVGFAQSSERLARESAAAWGIDPPQWS